MQTIMSTIQVLIVCGFVLFLTFIILLALPQSELRKFLMPIVGWGIAVFCAIWCISPIDLVPEAILGPFGLIDDIGAAVLGFYGAHIARKAS